VRSLKQQQIGQHDRWIRWAGEIYTVYRTLSLTAEW